MSLMLLVGGAASGKSRLAARIANARGGPVVVLATAEALDDEMRDRIGRHRAVRPAEWSTVEEPVDLSAALEAIPDDASVILDCLTLWVSNLMERGVDDRDIEQRAEYAASVAAARPSDTVVVTNEVGSGIVPVNELARRYRDVLGRVNRVWSDASDRVALVVAGRVLDLSAPQSLFGGIGDG